MVDEGRVVAESQERVSPIVPMFSREMLGIVLSGAGVGLIVAGVSFLLDRYVFSAVMCKGVGDGCEKAPLYAMLVAMIIGALLGLVALVQQRVYRPLLVVLSSSLGLWGIFSITEAMAWYWILVVTAAMFAVSYALFAWIARIRPFLIALIVSIVLVVAMRLIING